MRMFANFFSFVRSLSLSGNILDERIAYAIQLLHRRRQSPQFFLLFSFVRISNTMKLNNFLLFLFANICHPIHAHALEAERDECKHDFLQCCVYLASHSRSCANFCVVRREAEKKLRQTHTNAIANFKMNRKVFGRQSARNIDSFFVRFFFSVINRYMIFFSVATFLFHVCRCRIY